MAARRRKTRVHQKVLREESRVVTVTHDTVTRAFYIKLPSCTDESGDVESSVRRNAARELARSQENPDRRRGNEQTDGETDDERECLRVCDM